MKIAQIAPLIERVPPKKYGGTERVIYALTEELVRRNHDVTLFATADSITSARLVSVFPKSLRESRVKEVYGPNAWSMLNIGLAYQMQKKFDIIHDHNNAISLPTANIAQTPVVMTLHGAFNVSNIRLFQSLNNSFFVCISKSQSASLSKIPVAQTIYNGLAMNHYPFSTKPEKYLLCVGRISIEKGIHYAIEVAEYLNLPLIIAAKLEPSDSGYYRYYIEPNLSSDIRWIGEVDEKQRNLLMSKALCVLHPVTWKEPFGLTLIESMACGTPVIGFRKGSIPEIIQHGKTGFVVEDAEEMAEAITHLPSISRHYCRSYALSNFSAHRMADEYEDLYEKIIKKIKSKDYLFSPPQPTVKIPID